MDTFPLSLKYFIDKNFKTRYVPLFSTNEGKHEFMRCFVCI